MAFSLFVNRTTMMNVKPSFSSSTLMTYKPFNNITAFNFSPSITNRYYGDAYADREKALEDMIVKKHEEELLKKLKKDQNKKDNESEKSVSDKDNKKEGKEGKEKKEGKDKPKEGGKDEKGKDNNKKEGKEGKEKKEGKDKDKKK